MGFNLILVTHTQSAPSIFLPIPIRQRGGLRWSRAATLLRGGPTGAGSRILGQATLLPHHLLPPLRAPAEGAPGRTRVTRITAHEPPCESQSLAGTPAQASLRRHNVPLQLARHPKTQQDAEHSATAKSLRSHEEHLPIVIQTTARQHILQSPHRLRKVQPRARTY